MPVYLADTHSLLWYFTRPDLLGEAAQAALDDVAANNADLIVPVIVLAELIFVIEKRSLRVDFALILDHLHNSPNVRFLGLSLERTLDCLKLTAIPEMHDRLIVADALAQGAKLITCDKAIIASGLTPVVW